MASSGASPIFSPERICLIHCVICNQGIKKNEKSQTITDKTTFKTLATSWASLNIPLTVPENRYTEALQRIQKLESDSQKIIVHTTCRTRFRNYHPRFKAKYEKDREKDVHEPERNSENNAEQNATTAKASTSTRSKSGHVASMQKKCFVCNSFRTVDLSNYNQGGLRRCSRSDTASKVLKRKDSILQLNNHPLYPAAKRLQVILAGFHDIFAADVYFHQSCYIRFALNPLTPKNIDDDRKQKQKDVLALFEYRIRIRIIRDKNAFLQNELLKDVGEICNEQDLDDPPVQETRTLRRFIETKFPDEVSFYPAGKYVIVHASDVNPCTYSVATLQGSGLRDADLAKSFGKMIQRKLSTKKEKKVEFPMTPEELLALLDEGPLPELYNAIYYSMHSSGKINDHGYAITSELKATKIWSIASDWESLVTGNRSGKQITEGLSLHRKTGNKESVVDFSKRGHIISYNDIRRQNKCWAHMVSTKRGYYPSLRKGVVTHSTLDNNDGRQETWTGSGTTHDTNKTVFQLPTENELNTIKQIGEDVEALDLCDEVQNTSLEPQPFEIGKRVGPAVFSNLVLSKEKSEIDDSFKRDIAWSLAGMLTGEEYPLLGSWTPFMKLVSSFKTTACVQEFLPVTPHPPEYPVCKEYLDFMLDMCEDLEIPYIFVHSDELVYSKLCDILWNQPDLYSKIILLMGGFHQLRVMQRLLHKRYYCKGLRKWCVDSGTIAEGSADQAFEGRHYFRSMRVHKECFDSLVQYRVEKLTNNLTNIDADLLENLKKLRKDPTPSALMRLISTPSFNTLLRVVTAFESGSDGEMTVLYLRDVSLMLSLVSAVREANIEKHLQAEREMCYLTFAFDHMNYARYVSYENAYLSNLKQINHNAFIDMQERGFGGSITGDQFSTIHGDLITELFNKETKGTAGPFRAGFSTNIESVNTWVSTIHIHAKLRKALHTALHIKTSSKHKETTNRGKRLHQEHVASLKKTLNGYGIDPFADLPPRNMTTGTEIDCKVASDMIKSKSIGEKQFDQFAHDRLMTNTVGFFSPIKRNTLKTGIKKAKPSPKAVTVLKEDCQAFGLIISKSISLSEAFMHPITTYPLAAATADGDLRQSDKAAWRNFLINFCCAIRECAPTKAAWFVDGLAAVRTLKPKETYEEYMESISKFITPPNIAEATAMGMINDTYRKLSSKSGTRKKRGEKQSARTHVEGPKQHMPSGIKWQEFLSVGENKEQLISLLSNYFENLSKNNLLLMPLVFTTGAKTLHLENGKETVIKSCSHEEADTRLVLHAVEQDSDVVVVSKDTDVLVLLIWAYSTFKVSHNWYFKYEGEKYACISTIADSLGSDICSVLPAFHAVTGCDTTSYLFRIGKMRSFKKLMENPGKAELLKDLGQNATLQEECIEKVKEFIRTVLYGGKENETYVETRIRLYKNLKKKSSMPLPPDPDSLTQVIRRAHHQNYSWVRCCMWEFVSLPHVGNGWVIAINESDESTLRPLWFTGPQLPPSASKKKKNELPNSGQTAEVTEGFADDELAPKPTKKKRNKKRKRIKSPEVERNVSPEVLRIILPEVERVVHPEVERIISPEVEIEEILDKDVGELIVLDSERGELDSGTIADEDHEYDSDFNMYDSENEAEEWENWEEDFVSGEDSDDELWLP